MTIGEAIQQAKETDDFSPLVAAIPYAGFLNLHVGVYGDRVISSMPFCQDIVGNPRLPAIHGGVTGAFLECAAIFSLIAHRDMMTLPRIINITVDYLRSGKPLDSHATGTVTRLGRRVAVVQAEAWQATRSEPIATANAHFLVS